MNDKRIYKPIPNGSAWKNKVFALQKAVIVNPDLCVYAIHVDTTGLDTTTNRITSLVAIRCTFSDGKLVAGEKFKTLVNPGVMIPDEASRASGITNEMVAGAPGEDVALKSLSSFLGNSPVFLLGVCTATFLGPTLEGVMSRTGVKLNIRSCIDVLSMAKSLVVPTNKTKGFYSINSLRDHFGIKSTGTAVIVDIFNELYNLTPSGREHAKVIDARLWEKSYRCRYIYIDTDCGRVRLNCNTYAFEETSPGAFDVIDIDNLADYIKEKRKVSSLYEFVKLYPSKFA